MLGYVTLGSNDLPRAAKFYDAIAAEMGATRVMEFETYIAWGPEGGHPQISVVKPFDGEAASVGNGTMVALYADNTDQVQAIYNIALANGGTDEGTPGPRGGDGFYAAYFRDPDGNKLNICTMVK